VEGAEAVGAAFMQGAEEAAAGICRSRGGGVDPFGAEGAPAVILFSFFFCADSDPWEGEAVVSDSFPLTRNGNIAYTPNTL
jgi:hypothetical protein